MAMEAPNRSISCDMVALGMGVTLAHPLVARDCLHRDVLVLPFKPDILFPTYVIWLTTQARTRLAEEFIETLRGFYREAFAAV